MPPEPNPSTLDAEKALPTQPAPTPALRRFSGATRRFIGLTIWHDLSALFQVVGGVLAVVSALGTAIFFILRHYDSRDETIEAPSGGVAGIVTPADDAAQIVSPIPAVDNDQTNIERAAVPETLPLNDEPQIDVVEVDAVPSVVGLEPRDPAPPPSDTVFRDCAQCPELATVPSGSFRLGSPQAEIGRDDADDEDSAAGAGGDVIDINIASSFAVGLNEITWNEWEACVQASACRVIESDEGWGKGTRPVINVFWSDAQAYVAWLSATTGYRYRLLTEAEWEYAARAGTTTPYSTGDSLLTSQANFGREGGSTMPVRSYAPNPFGLYDMHGNVWEWVEDCYRDSYAGLPASGAAVSAGDCDRHVIRGGSYWEPVDALRSANRGAPSSRGYADDIGFRVARDL